MIVQYFIDWATVIADIDEGRSFELLFQLQKTIIKNGVLKGY